MPGPDGFASDLGCSEWRQFALPPQPHYHHHHKTQLKGGVEAPPGPRAHSPPAPLLRFPESCTEGRPTWKVQSATAGESVNTNPHGGLASSHKPSPPWPAWEAPGAGGGGGQHRELHAGLAQQPEELGFPQAELAGGLEACGGRAGGRGGWRRRRVDAEAAGRKEGCDEDSRRGSGAPGQTTSQAQIPSPT